MRLSQFITANNERILENFESFARTIVPGGTMDMAALRDHAAAMLAVIVRDLETPQTDREGFEKSFGKSDSSDSTPDTPAQEHGSGRATDGFTFVEMVSEYRALRASVIRLWIEKAGELNDDDLEDLVRFNEGIDQALAESTLRFTTDLDRTRDTFLGILSHDLRSPLGAVVTSAQFMLEETELSAPARTLTKTILSSGNRMNEMVGNLLDFTRGRLGVAMPILKAKLDLAKVLQDAVAEMKASRPGSDITLTVFGDVTGEWDEARLRQVLSNLLSNALNHGGGDGPVAVSAQGSVAEVIFSVHNDGPLIPEGKMAEIFQPLSRSATASRDPQHMGLGLFIAQQVVSGHGGTIKVDSTAESGTTFTVSLPRAVQPVATPPGSVVAPLAQPHYALGPS
jgi:signal transduction histidine kinase